MTLSWSPWHEGGDKLRGRMLSLESADWLECPVLPLSVCDTFSNKENSFLRQLINYNKYDLVIIK